MRYFNCLNPVHTLSELQMSSCPKIVARTASIIFFTIIIMLALCTFLVLKFGDPVEENDSESTSSSTVQTFENFSRYSRSNRSKNSKSLGKLQKEKQKYVPLGMVACAIIFSIFIYLGVFRIFKLKINRHKSIIDNYMDKYGVSKEQAIKDTYNF